MLAKLCLPLFCMVVGTGIIRTMMGSNYFSAVLVLFTTVVSGMIFLCPRVGAIPVDLVAYNFKCLATQDNNLVM